MKLQVFSVFDRAVGCYLQPFYARSHGEAHRMFEGACMNPEHVFAKHAADYRLYHLGEFDEETGAFSMRDAPDFQCSADSIVNQMTLPLHKDAAQ